MSTVVENRVVQMDFDNSKFLSGIKSSIGGLKDMTETMAAVNGKNGLQNLASGMTSIGTTVTGLSDKFSTWGIVAKTVIENLTDRVVNDLLGGLQKVDNFLQLQVITVGSISEGWGKYAEKTEAVATIMAATGKDVEYVSEQMQRLNWFTDETSYNFTDMASNIGKFTANQIPLENAVTQMEGIATWAAVSGQNAASASRAMYNMAQAIGVGSVKLMDWKSIENANMATSNFKNNVIKTAEAMGVLKLKTADANDELKNIYEIVGSGKEVSVKNFNQELSTGWFSADVLQRVLEKYGNFSQGVNDLYQTFQDAGKDVLTADIVKKGGLIDQYAAADAAGKIKLVAEAIKGTNIEAEWLTAKLEDLSSAENEVGRQAFKAAQEASTFNAAIDATKDAASTLWMNIYEKLFGNVEQATVIWSDFCQFLYEAFVEPLWDIYDEISTFVEAGGMISLLNGLGKLGDAFLTVSKVVRASLSGVLSNALIKAAGKLSIFGSKVKIIVDRLNSFKSADGLTDLERIVDVFRNIWNAFKSFIKPIKDAWDSIFPKKSLNETYGLIQSFIGKLYRFSETLGLSSEQGKKVQHIFETIFGILKKVGTAIFSLAQYLKPLWDAFTDLADAVLTAIDGVAGFYDELNKGKEDTSFLQGIISAIADAIGWLSEKIRNFSLSETWQSIKTFFTNAWNFVKDIVDKIKIALKDVNIPGLLFGSGVAAAGFGIGGLAGKLGDFVDKLKNPSKILKELGDSIGGFIDGIKEKLGGGDKGGDNIVSMFKDFAIAIGILAASLLVLSMLDLGKVLASVVFLGGMIAIVAGAIDVISESLKGVKTAKIIALGVTLIFIASAMLIMATAVVVMAGALALFALVAKMDTVWVGVGLMAVSILALGLALGVLSKVCNPAALMATAAAMLIMSAAVLVLAIALGAFVAIAKLAGDDATQAGILAMIVTVGLLAAILGALAKLVNPVRLIAAATAVLILAAAVAVLAVAFAAFTVVMAAGGDSAIAGLAAMLGIIVVMVTALAVLSLIGPMVIVAAAACLVFAVAAGILSAAFLVVVVAIDLLIAGLYLLGPALASIGAGIESMAISISDGFKTAMENLGQGIGGFIGGIFEGIADAIARGLEHITSSLDDFGSTVETIGLNIENFGISLTTLKDIPWTSIALGLIEIGGGFASLIKDTKKLSDTVSNTSTLAKALSSIASFGASANSQLTELSVSFTNLGQVSIDGFTRSISSGFTSAVTIVKTGCTQMVSAIKVTSAAFRTQGTLIIVSFAAGITGAAYQAVNAGAYVARSAYNSAAANNGGWYNLGINAAIGYANGIFAYAARAATQAYNMVINAKKAAARAQDSKSPSKEFAKLGSYAGQGYALGIESETKNVESSVTSMVGAAISRIDSAFGSDIQPTIRPVIDTTQVRKGMEAVSGMLDSSNTYTIGANLASTIRSGQNGGDSSVKQSVTLDEASIKALKSQKVEVNSVVNFEGNLAQLGAVLQPVIKSEETRRGPSLVNSAR